MLSMKSCKAATIVLVIILGAVVVSFAASVPQIINYQGTLKSINGTPANGPVNMAFSVYSSATGGSPVWTENWSSTATPANPVIVTSGSFNVMLGALNPFSSTFFADHPKTYLGIKVGTDSEMLPRQQFASVGYSFVAGNGIPKGGIIMWSGAVNQVPDGWAICDGQNGTPNLQDRFIVGAGSGYAAGAIGGEATHVLTANEMPSHTHTQNAHSHYMLGAEIKVWGSTASGTQLNPWVGSGSGGTKYASETTQSATATNQNTGSDQAHNNLPPYYALAFIMKL